MSKTVDQVISEQARKAALSYTRPNHIQAGKKSWVTRRKNLEAKLAKSKEGK